MAATLIEIGTSPQGPLCWGKHNPSWMIAAAAKIPGRSRHIRAIKRGILRRCGPADGVVDVMHSGMRIRCHTLDNATERNIAVAADRDNTEKVQIVIAQLAPGGTFVDIGANCGLFTLMAARSVGATGAVLAIEPSPKMLSRLRYNIAANSLRNVYVIGAAAGEQSGEADLNINSSKLGASSILAIVDSTTVSVPMVTLAAALCSAGLDRVDALKIDIEGYEDRALLPLLDTAPSTLWPAAVLIETKWRSRWQRDCLEEMTRRGYRIARKFQHDALLSKREDSKWG